jgi:hypothetical protein
MYEKAFPFFPSPRFAFALFAAFAAAAAFGLAGCQPQIGDRCVLNTDCSISGTRQCDTSLPGGYCTIFNCGPNSCPDQSACYLFYSEVQGCPYDDHQPSRTAHSFCMKDCQQDGDCRAGYVCKTLRELSGPPWDALLLDDNQNQNVCVPVPDQGDSGVPDANAPPLPVCQANPDIDAAFPPPPEAGPPPLDAALGPDGSAEAGPADAAPDATLDAGADATLDAGSDGSDAGAPDGTLD